MIGSFGSCATIFEERAVVAVLRRVARSEREMGMDISVRISIDLAAARWKDSDMTVGCMPLPSNRSAAPRRLPAITTTDVVPSPASMSWACARSTSIFAEGCMTLIWFSIVAPSLV